MDVRTEDGIKVITLEKRVLGENDRYAAENRTLFSRRGLLVLNLISSPGAGKTTLLVETLAGCAAR
jgi:hydrogenase nickel incorporation protein HypB